MESNQLLLVEPESIFDEMFSLQLSIKNEIELQNMFSRLFETQINQTLHRMHCDFVIQDVRARSDLEQLKYEVQHQEITAEIKKATKLLEEGKTENKSDVEKLLKMKVELVKPKVQLIEENALR